jgi:hypothetical protein
MIKEMNIYYLNHPLLDYDICKALWGFKLYYGVTLKPISNIGYIDVLDKYNIFVGDLKNTKQLFHDNNLKFHQVEDYPSALRIFLGRNITKGKFKEIFCKKHNNKFIKPQYTKHFIPFIKDEDIDLTGYLHIHEDCPIYISDILYFKEEYRIFVNNGQVVGISNYKGLPGEVNIDIESMVKKVHYPSFCMDVGNTEDDCYLVECNSGICFGSYGLSPEHYASMIYNYWIFLMELNS